MYNLTVDVAHTFFVGEEQWLVHNAGCLVSLTAGPNAKEHYRAHKKILERALNTEYDDWSKKTKNTFADVFLKDLSNLINNGKLHYHGAGTLQKDFPVHVYRGTVNGVGMTVITKPNGEWVTLLERGKGQDLNGFLPPDIGDKALK